jgi:hypothetical protein
MQEEQATTQKVMAMATLLMEKKSFIEVIYYADKSNFMDYLPVVEKMIDSFELLITRPIIQED